MISQDELTRSTPESAELNRYSIRVWAVLSLILSLAVIVILSKRQVVTHYWAYVAAFVVPISLTLYFRNRIVQFGPFVYVAALIAMLVAAIAFGI